MFLLRRVPRLVTSSAWKQEAILQELSWSTVGTILWLTKTRLGPVWVAFSPIHVYQFPGTIY